MNDTVFCSNSCRMVNAGSARKGTTVAEKPLENAVRGDSFFARALSKKFVDVIGVPSNLDAMAYAWRAYSFGGTFHSCFEVRKERSHTPEVPPD